MKAAAGVSPFLRLDHLAQLVDSSRAPDQPVHRAAAGTQLAHLALETRGLQRPLCLNWSGTFQVEIIMYSGGGEFGVQAFAGN